MAPPKVLGDNSNLGNEFVTIYVGKKRKEYVVHKKVICDAADYFSKAFTGAFIEREGIMHLPEETSEAFGLFVDYLYRGTVPSVSSQAHLERLLKLFVFAEKLCMHELCNETIDTIRDLCSMYAAAKITSVMVGYLYKNTFTDSPIRTWSLDDLLFHIDQTNKTGIPKKEHSQTFRKMRTPR
ncbi:hypothetical protein LSUE1_G003296 [Lachnellula suecica]|uniref:BTB domain-containing protein n=1 Tax=Lachnellula suecica TaxID=602035 RepID=A0A8T9CG82_9HELO|nr:hypothetical protein LSUE1_G003296 [Lachnellula suecica]